MKVLMVWVPYPLVETLKATRIWSGVNLLLITRWCRDPSSNICFPYLVLFGAEMAKVIHVLESSKDI